MKKVIYIGSFSDKDKQKEELTEECVREIDSQFADLSKACSSEPIVFYIGACRGGDIIPVLDLTEKIGRSKVPSVAIVLARASSAAALLVAGCHTRLAYPEAVFTLHPIQLHLKISVARLEPGGRLPRDVRHLIGKQNQRLAKFLLSKTGLKKERIKAIMSFKGHATFTSYQALDAGIIDEVLPVFPKS